VEKLYNFSTLMLEEAYELILGLVLVDGIPHADSEEERDIIAS
jgi:hypothetical protein